MALTIYTAEALSKLSFLEQVDVLKKQVDTLRPLPKEIEDRVLQKLRLEWNYHSNAIEGNQLSYGETVAFIMEGITAKGKTLKDHLDIKGHDEAIKYLLDIVKNADYVLNEADIRNLHQLLLKENYFVDAQTPSGEKTRKEIKIGQYKSSPNHVLTATGETHYYASPEQVPMRMGDLMDWYKQAKENKSVHPVVLATLFHHEFTAIHPFDDGNGRMGRLLLNLMLLQNGYPPIVVKQNDKLNYYQVLRQADAGEMVPINEYMSALVEHSLNIYIKAANGESIEEEDDIDKEIALFKMSNASIIAENESVLDLSKVDLNTLITVHINPFLRKINDRLFQLFELFNGSNITIVIHSGNVEKTFTDFNDYFAYINSLAANEFNYIESIDFLSTLNNLKSAYLSSVNSEIDLRINFVTQAICISYSPVDLLIIRYGDNSLNIQLKELSDRLFKTLLEKLKVDMNG